MHISKAEFVRGFDADGDLFNRAGAVIAGGTSDGNLRRLSLVRGDEVIL